MHHLLAYLGILRAGLVCVPVNIRQPAAIVRYICDDSGMQFAFADEAGAALVPDGVEHAPLAPVPAPGRGPHAEFPTVDERSTALVLYTSGSTGRPKGVVLSHCSQLSMVNAVTGGSDSRLFAGQRGIVAAPMFHMNALVFIASFLKGGGSIVLMSRFDAAMFAEAIGRYGVNVITGVPTMIAILHARGGTWASRTSAASVPSTSARPRSPRPSSPSRGDAAERHGPELLRHDRDRRRPVRAAPRRSGSPTHFRGLSHTARGGAANDDGVLLVKAPSMMSGYLNLPELTERKLRDGWFTTGDLFERDRDGFYFFKGRADDMFVCSGENVYPGRWSRRSSRMQGCCRRRWCPYRMTCAARCRWRSSSRWAPRSARGRSRTRQGTSRALPLPEAGLVPGFPAAGEHDEGRSPGTDAPGRGVGRAPERPVVADHADQRRSPYPLADAVPEAELQRQVDELASAKNRGLVRGMPTYLKLGGPGFIGAARTLGAGTMTSSMLAGAEFGYRTL